MPSTSSSRFVPHKKVLATSTLNHSEFGKIRHLFAELSRLGNPESFESRLSASSHTLAISMSNFLRSGFQGTPHRSPTSLKSLRTLPQALKPRV